MAILKQNQQKNVGQQLRMPTNNSNADQIISVTGANAWDGVIKYYNAGVLTTDAGQAAGTVVVIKAVNNNILNALGDAIGSFNDTSVAFTTGTILTTRRALDYNVWEQYSDQSGTTKAQALTAGFANGEYCIDHESGTIYGVKATNGTTDTLTYKIYTPATGGTVAPADNVNVSAWGGTATTLGQKAMTASVPVVIASDQSDVNVKDLNKLVPFEFDYVSATYTGVNPTTVVYKTGGAGGTTVATLTNTFDGNDNLLTSTRT